jgi:hypothetical protein
MQVVASVATSTFEYREQLVHHGIVGVKRGLGNGGQRTAAIAHI